MFPKLTMIAHSTASHIHLSCPAVDWGSPAPPHLPRLCPLTKRIIRLARRCRCRCRLTPFGSRWGGDTGSGFYPPRSPAHAPASGPPGGALVSPQVLTASPPPPVRPAIGLPPRPLSSDWSLSTSVTGAGAGRSDARRLGLGRCPAPAAAGRGWRGPTRGSQAAAILGGVSASLSRSSPAAATTTALSSRPGLPRPSMRYRAAA